MSAPLPALSRPDPGRVALVTAGLSVAGAAFGGIAGATALGIVLLASGGVALRDFMVLAIPGVIGAALGAVLTPIAGWLLLRRVPLGRAFAWLTAGTVAGGILGTLPGLMSVSFLFPIFTAAAGFSCTALALRALHSRVLPANASEG
jgi:hypothetical protein